MESLTTAEIHKHLKLVTGPHIRSLTRLYTAPIEEPSKEVQEKIAQLKLDAQLLSKGIAVFAHKCLQESNGGEELIKDLDDELTSWLLLSKRFTKEPDYEDFHPSIPRYLLLIRTEIKPLRRSLRKKTGYSRKTRGPTPPVGKTIVKAHKVKIIQNNAPVPAAPPEKLFSKEAFASPAEESSGGEPQEEDPGKEPILMGQPPADLQLPDFLEVLPLKADQKALFLRFLWFIRTNVLPFKLRVYALLLMELDLVLEEHYSLKKDSDLMISRTCGSLAKVPREASGFRCKYRNPKSKAKDRYLLKGEYPEFEMQVKSLL